MAGLRGRDGQHPSGQLQGVLLSTRPRRALTLPRGLPGRRQNPRPHPLPRGLREVPRRPRHRRGLRQDQARPARSRPRRSRRRRLRRRRREAGVVREDADAVGRQQRRGVLGPEVLRGDDLPEAGLRGGPTGPERGRQGRPRRRLEVPPHLQGDPPPPPPHHRLEQLRQPQEAPRRRLHRLPPLRLRRHLRRDPPRQALRRRVGRSAEGGARREGEGGGGGGGGGAGCGGAGFRGGVPPAAEHAGVLRQGVGREGGDEGPLVARDEVQDGLRDGGLVSDQLVHGDGGRGPGCRPGPLGPLPLAPPPGGLGRARPPPQRQAGQPVARRARQPRPLVLPVPVPVPADEEAQVGPPAPVLRRPPRAQSQSQSQSQQPLHHHSRRHTGSQACSFRDIPIRSPPPQPLASAHPGPDPDRSQITRGPDPDRSHRRYRPCQPRQEAGPPPVRALRPAHPHRAADLRGRLGALQAGRGRREDSGPSGPRLLRGAAPQAGCHVRDRPLRDSKPRPLPRRRRGPQARRGRTLQRFCEDRKKSHHFDRFRQQECRKDVDYWNAKRRERARRFEQDRTFEHLCLILLG